MCLGKHWLFAGSDSAGKRAAAAYPLIKPAELQVYLLHVLIEETAKHALYE
jgi:hypothetical protein